MTMNIGPKYEEYQRAKRLNDEAREWLGHIGKKGKGTDVLKLSVAHAGVKMVIAGQYSESGTNYRDSPKAFNAALLEYIHDNFDFICAAVVGKMDRIESEAKEATKDELQAALDKLKQG